LVFPSLESSSDLQIKNEDEGHCCSSDLVFPSLDHLILPYF